MEIPQIDDKKWREIRGHLHSVSSQANAMLFMKDIFDEAVKAYELIRNYKSVIEEDRKIGEELTERIKQLDTEVAQLEGVISSLSNQITQKREEYNEAVRQYEIFKSQLK